MFQSQTGSQALSDEDYADLGEPDTDGFNPKREARPSQTRAATIVDRCAPLVSIPNGKPGPLRLIPYGNRLRKRFCFNPKREARPSQTGLHERHHDRCASFNPKREARPSQTSTGHRRR